jgi:hypothetical protein
VDANQPIRAVEGISMSQPSRGSEDWSLRVYPVPDSDSGRRVLERWCRVRLESALQPLAHRIGVECSIQEAPRIVAMDEPAEGMSDWTTFRWAAEDDRSIGYLSIETHCLRRCLLGFLGERSEFRISGSPWSGLELRLSESALQPLEAMLDGCMVPGLGRVTFAADTAATGSLFDHSSAHGRWTRWRAKVRVGGTVGGWLLTIHKPIVDQVLIGSDGPAGPLDADDQTAMRLDALLVHAQVSGRGWGDLQKGDVVDCQRSVEDPILLCIEGKPAYWAKLGLANGRRAVQILSAVESS